MKYMWQGRDENMDVLSRHFSDINPIRFIDPETCLKVNIKGYVEYLGIFKKDKMIAYMSIMENDIIKLPGILQTMTDVNFRRQGWIRYLITYFLESNSCLCSDESHSPEAKNMWQSLIKTPANLKFYIIDKTTGEKTQIFSNQNMDIIPDPWSNDNFLILATKRELSEHALKSLKMKEILYGWKPYGVEYENSSVWNP